MAKKAKRPVPIERRIDGFVWLARHSRKAAIIAYVKGKSDAAPDWLKADRCWPKVRRDRTVYQTANTMGTSFRDVATALKNAGVDVSYTTVSNVLAVYDGPDAPELPEGGKRLSLKQFAKAAVTRDVVARFDAGEVTASDVAALIGNGADVRNAVYWVRRMREIYDRQDAAAAGARKAKRR